MRILGWAVFCGLICAVTGFGAESRYPSGLLRHFAAEGAFEVQNESRAVSEFIAREYGSSDFQWRRTQRVADRQHIHLRFDLFYHGRRVFGRQLKVHYNRRGFIEYASSDWSIGQSVAMAADPGPLEADRKNEVLDQFQDRHGRPPGLLKLLPVIWVSEDSTQARAAFEVTLVDRRTGTFRRFFIDEKSGSLLQELRVSRSILNKVFKVHPNSPTAGSSLSTETLPTVTGSTLETPFFHVRREEWNGTINELKEVDPNTDFATNAGLSTPANLDPSNYASDCTGAATGCPNQGFDAVNLLYHLENYRTRLRDYLTALGIVLDLPVEPLPVVVNFDYYGDGYTVDSETVSEEFNNAAYLSTPCTDDGTMEKCLIFLPPTPVGVSSTTCGANKKFYSLAREAVVAVHEYQHYITDVATGLIPGASAHNVGDALHEGYSDYFAASHVTNQAGYTVTVVGEYAFQQCAAIARDIGTIKVYDIDNTDPGPHVYGWSWASGLWQLREELGMAVVDKLALKSLFLLSPTPGFVDAVEALVEADQALNAGANVKRIRQLFYSEIKFIGGAEGQFRDVDNAIVEMGMHSCLSAAIPGVTHSGLGSFGLFLGWLALSLWAGRKRQ